MKNQFYKSILSRILFLIILLFSIGIKQVNAQLSCYGLTQSTGTYSPISGGTVLSAAGVINDDNTYTGVPIGFNFSYLGNTYTTLGVTANGYMQFGGTISNGSLYNGTSMPTILNGIHILSEDLYGTSSTCEISYTTTGSTGNRIFTIQWKDWGFYSTGGSEINFQAKLYEGSNTIQFIYNPGTPATSQTCQIGLTGAATTEFLGVTNTSLNWTAYSLMTSNSQQALYSTTNYPAAGLTYTFAITSMVIDSSSTVSATLGNIPSGTNDNRIVSVQVYTRGCINPKSVTQLSLSTNGTTSASDITNANVYYTGSSPIFSTANQFGSTVVSPSGNFTVNGNQTLTGGTNYFWLAYDISSSATANNLVDAECNLVTFNTGNSTPIVQAPVGNRTIKAPLNGNYTVGLAGTYTNITTAVADLNSLGAVGPVTFSLIDANYTNETFPITINAYPGMSNINTLTIRPDISATNVLIQNVNLTSGVFVINSAKYVTIDGRPGGAGTTRALSIVNFAVSSFPAVTYQNDAIGSNLRYCVIRTSNTLTSGANAGSVFIGASTLFNGNDSITISNNYFARTSLGGYGNAIYAQGQSANIQNDYINISNNEFNGFLFNGIYNISTSNGNGSYWTVNANSFYDTLTTSAYLSTWTAINLAPSNAGASNYYIITNNYIGGQAALCGGGPLTNTSSVVRQGILLSTANGPANTIYGNVIQNIFINNTAITSQFTGINATLGAVNIDSNIIGSLTIANSINLVTNSVFLGINATPTTVNLNITRNVIANITHNFITSASGGVRAMNIGGSAITTISNNTIKALTTNAANVGTTTTVSMGGIICSGSGTNNITNNTIGTGLGLYDGLSNTNNSVSAVRVTGIYVSGGATTISNNTIDGLSMNNTATTTVGTTTTANMLGICNASTLAGQVTSNNIVKHLFINSAAIAQNTSMIGILHGSVGAHTISGNTVYGLLSRSTNIGTTTSSAVNAIMNSSSGQSTITNNYIDSIVLNTPTGTTTTLNGIIIIGTTGNSISGNTIKSMYTNSTIAYGMLGIYLTSGVINQSVISNRVFNLVNFNATAVVNSIVGIRIISSTSLTSNTNLISRNLVHSFRLYSTGAGLMIGIENQQGLNTFTNNMIRLGVDSLGINSAGPYVMYGFHDFYNASNIPSYYYHNSVYIAGSPTSGASITAAMFSPNSSKPLTIRNNIFVNNTTNAGGTGFNYALRINNTFNISSNFNILFASNTNGFITSTISPATNYTNLLGASGWINVTRLDAQSGNVNPGFLTPNGTSSTINLRLAASNPAEGGGDPNIAPLVTVSNDFDGNDRSTLTPNDIGAQAGNFTLSKDTITPTITYTNLTNTASVSNYTLTATITDNGGITTSSIDILRPRIYYRKNGGTWYSNGGTLVSGTAVNGVWNLTIDYTLVGGVVPLDQIQYYVIAQDLSNNIMSNPLYAIASNVNTVTTIPTTNFFNITSPIDTLLIVGPAPSNYLTLNAAFTAINNGILQRNTQILIKPGTIVESAPSLNQWLEINNGVMGSYNYTLTIRPQTNSLVTLNLGSSSITLNGADRVTFLGYDTLGTVNDSNLIITSTSTALNIQNDATGNTFKNVIFAGSGSYVVFISSAAITTGNDNQTFDKCKFRSSNLPTMPAYSFWNSGTTGKENDSLLITNSEFYNATSYQLLLNGGLGNMIRIKNNHFYQQLSSSLIANIYFGPGTLSNNDTISSNSIGGTTINADGTPLLNAYTSQYAPIYILSNGSQTGVSVTDNVIKNITMTAAGYIYGIYAASGVVNINRNMIGDTTAVSPKGISLSATSVSQSYGIYGQSSSPITINNNYISNFTSAGNGAIAGIYNGNGVTQMNNNLVQNFANTNVAGASVRLVGIQNSVSTITQMNGNTVRNFLCNSANIGTTTSAAVLGIMNNSATALSISNNTVQNLTNTNNTATNSMYGIYHSSGLAIMSGNTVDGLTSSGTYTGTATIAGLGGLFNSSGTQGQTISNNIVRNLTQTGAITAAKQVIGLMVSAGGQHTITGNTVQGIRSNSSSTSTTTGSSIIGMYITPSSAQMVVSNNTINTLENTYSASALAVNVIGLYYSNSITTGTNIIDRNFIHSLFANNLNTGTCGINGLFINSSTNGTFSNNMIRLGIDSSGISFTNPCAINGIYLLPGSVNDIYHNSVYIGGAPSSGTSNTHAFQMATNSTSVVNIKNNIFQNAVMSAGSLGSNYAIRLSSATNINCNNNIYFTPTNIYSFVGNLSGVNYQLLSGAASWQLGTGLDSKSGFGNPLFMNVTGVGALVNLRLQNNNPAESNGDATITAVSTDFDGNTRSSLTPTDIGASAGNNTVGVDIFAPTISYSPINNTGDVIGPITISGINVTDPQGIFTSGILTPKMYIKKGINGTFTAISPSSITGTSRNTNLDFSISYSSIGGVAVLDTIYYYVIAQDSAGNISSAPAYAVATNVNTIITDPINAGFFRILPAIPGGTKFYVGSGQTYTSFTNAGGLFEYLNNNAIGGNVSAVVTSNINGETGSVSLSQMGESGTGAGSYTFNIRPDSSAVTIRTISGSASALFNLNGADRVKISGVPDISSNNSLQLLRIRNNSSSGSTILMTNGAQGNKLSNIIIEGANTTLNLIGSGVVCFGNPSVLAGNSFDSLSNCIIRNNTTMTQPIGVPTIAIQSFTSTIAILNSNNFINGNSIQNFGGYGINMEVGTGSNWVISNNSFFNDLTSPPNSLGLSVMSIRINAGLLSEGHTISSNFIGGQAANCGGSPWTNNLVVAFQAMVMNVGNNNATIIQNNTIKNINLTSFATGAQFIGINHTGGKLTVGGSATTGNTYGDPTNTSSISLAGANIHFGISTGTGVASVPLVITYNNFQGININSAGNNAGYSAMQIQGGVPVISNNTIGHASTANSISSNGNAFIRGILITNAVGVAPTTIITNNTFANLSATGTQSAVGINAIHVQGTSVTTVTGNSIYNLSTNSSNTASGVGSSLAASGIIYSASGAPIGSVINNNLLYNIAVNNAGTVLTNVAAITATGPISMDISRNKIYDIKNLSTSTGFNPMATATGILLGTFTTSVDVTNNQISLGNGISNNAQFNGIWASQTNASLYINCLYNSVVISGTVTSGSLPSYAFHRGNNTTGEISMNLRLVNNVLVNARSGGSTKNYAIANEVLGTASGTGWLSSGINYNLLGSSSAAYAALWANSDQTINSWRTISGSDNNSYYDVTGTGANQINIATLFPNYLTADFSPNTSSSQSWYLNGKGIAGSVSNSLSSDFSSNTRGTTLGFGTDIGAFEFSTNTAPLSAVLSGSIGVGQTQTISFANREIGSVTWVSGTLPSALDVKFYSGSNPPSPTVPIQYLNTYWDMSATGGSGYLFNINLTYPDALLGTLGSKTYLNTVRKIGSGSWVTLGTPSVSNVSTNRITNSSNISSFGLFTGTDQCSEVPPITGEDSMCVGSTFTYSIPYNAGHIYVWTAIGGTFNGRRDTSEVSITWVTAGNRTLMAFDSIPGSRCQSTSTLPIKTFAYPTPVITGVNAICANNSATYSTPSNTGRTYVWTVVGGTISTGQSTSTINVLWGSAGTGSITVSDSLNATGCMTTTAAYSVTINPNPTPAISGVSAICANNSTIYTTPSNTGRTYVWTINGGSVTSGQGTSAATVLFGSAGSGSVIVSDSVNATGCKISTVAQIVTINPNPTPAISGVTAICANNSATYTIPTNTGRTYAWTVTGGTISSGQGSASATIAWGSAGTGTLIVSDSVNATGCKTTTTAYSVTINPNPTPAISGVTAICENNSATYTIPSNTGRTYVWTVTGGTISSGQGSTSINVAWGAFGTGTAVVNETISATSCNTTTVAYNITKNAYPTPVISGSGTVCLNSTTSYSIANNSGRTYVWSVTGGVIGSGQGTNSISINWAGVGLGTVNVSDSVNSTGCKTNAVTYQVNVNNSPNPIISGSTVSCQNQIKTYSTTANIGSAYTWFVNNGTITSGAGTNTISVLWPSVGARSLQVTDSILAGGCKTTTPPYNVTVYLTPTPVISGVSNICANNSANYLTPFNAGRSYLWNVTGGIISAGQGTNNITVDWSSGGVGSITVSDSVNVTGCKSISSVFNVTINPNPTPIISGLTSVCANSSASYSTSTSTGKTYIWNISGGTISSGQNTNSINVNWGIAGTGTLILTERNNTTLCEVITSNYNVTINANPTPVISGPTSACAYSNSSFSTPSNPGRTYTWLIAGGSVTSGQGLSNPIITWGGAGTGITFVTDSVNATGCKTSTVGYFTVLNSAPNPIVSGSSSVCANSSATYSTTSNIGSTYVWTVTGGTISSGQSTNSISVNWGSTGIGTARLVETNSTTLCATTSSIYSVTINSNPTPVVSGSTSVCANSSATYSTPTNTGRTYVWTVTGGTITAGQNTNSVNITWGIAGTGTAMVSETITSSSCVTTTAAYSVTINSNPTPVVSGLTSVCANSTASYSTPTNTGRTYVWTVSGGTITSGQNTNSVNITWGSAGTGTAMVAETITSSSCVTTTAAYSVTINANPTPVVSGTSSVCANSTATYSTPSNTGRNYLWTITGGTITGGQGTASINVNWASAGSGSLTVRDSVTSTGCKATTAAYAVTINVIPTPIVSGSTSVCANSSATYSTPSNTGRTYVWTVTGGTITSGQGTASATIAWSGSGVGSLIVSDSVNATGCKATTAAYLVSINAIPTPIVSGSTSACANSSVSYSTPSNTGRNYLWTITGGTISSGQGTASINVNWASAGSGSLTVRDSVTATGCKATTAAYSVTINANPTPVVSGLTTVCANSTATYSTPTNTGRTYVWTVTGGTITSGQNTNSVNITWGSAGTGTAMVAETITSSSCVVTTAAYSVTINANPTPVVSGSTLVCANGTAIYSTLSNTGRNYLWTITGGTISSGQGTASINVSWASAGSGSLTVRDSVTATGCIATTAAYSVTINSNPTPVVSGVNSICENNTAIYSTPFNSGRTYNWTVTGGTISSGQGSSSISIAWGSAGTGTVSVSDSINSSGCKVTSSVFNVTKNSLPIPVINGSGAVCANSTNSYSISSGTGRTSTWVIVGGTIISGQGTSTISVNWGGTSLGLLYVTDSINSSGCKATSTTRFISLNTIPTPVITGVTSLCSGSAATYSTTNNSGSIYTWQVTNGTITAGAGTSSINVTWSNSLTGTLVLTDSVSNLGCKATSNSYNVTINQLPQPVITGDDTICGGTTSAYSTPNNLNRSYKWTVNGGTILTGQNTSNISVLWNNSGSGSIAVLDSNNLTRCKVTTAALAITILNKPANAIVGLNTICGATTATYSVPFSIGHNYRWTIANGSIVKGQNTDSIEVIWNKNGNGNVSLVDSVPSTNCVGYASMNTTINSLPNDTISVSGSLNICAGNSVVLIAKYGADLTYNWKKNGSFIPNLNGSSLLVDTTGSYTVEIENNMTGCKANSTIFTTTLLPNPIVNLGPDTNICQGKQVTLNAGSGFDLYLWSTGDTTQTINTYNKGNIIVFVKGTNGCFNSDTVTINYNVEPNANFTFTQKAGSATFTPEQNGLEYLWFFGDGDTSTTKVPTHTYSKNGIFITYLVTRNASGCVDSISKSVQINTVGINNGTAAEFEMSVYPNPFINVLNLNIQSFKSGNATIRIVDVRGSLMYETNVNTKYGNNVFELNNIPEMEDGMYFINITQGTQNSIYKIVKTH